MLPVLAIALAMQPDPAMLRTLYADALARREKQYGPTDARTAQAARDLSLFLARHSNPEEAQPVLARLVAIDEHAFGPAAPQTLADVVELAAISPPGAAEPLWRRASLSSDPAIAARCFAALGDLHLRSGDRPGAAAFYRRALAKEETASGPAAEPVALRLNALALSLDPKDGIPLAERALAIDRRVLGARHPQTATTEANLAGMLVNVRRNSEAVRAAADAMSIFQETLGPAHPRCAVTASILAFALEATGDRTRAEQMYRMAVAIDQKAYGPAHPQTEADQRALAAFLASAPH